MAGIAGFSGVILASMGSHLDAVADDAQAYRAWQSAIIVHLLHAAALLGLAALDRSLGSKILRRSGWIMALGIVLFSGSIYTRILTESSGAGILAPVGGVCLLLAWLGIVGAVLVAKAESP